MAEGCSHEGYAIVKPLPRAAPRRGAYFLANDAILDIAIAFLNSFRIHNPILPLCLIPFDDDFERLSALSGAYNFTIFDNDDMLRRCDNLSMKFFDWRCGQFRKLCAFEGDYDDFIYIDCDTIILGDVYFTFQFLEIADFITSHSDEPHLRQWVWKESIYLAGVLDARQIAFSANTGFFCSSKELFTVARLESDVGKSLALKRHLELGCAEQAYLNHIVVTSGCRYTSLKKIRHDSGYWELPLERWAGDKGRLRSWFGGLRSRARAEILLVHWAGMWSARPFDRVIYAARSRIGIPSRTPSVRYFMRHKWLWKYYRHYTFTPVAASAARSNSVMNDAGSREPEAIGDLSSP